MTLKDQISQDMKEAMKAKNDIALQTLRMARTEILKMEKDGRTEELTDTDIQAILQRLIKQRKDSAEQFRAGGRAEMADREEAEIEVLKGYLPEEISDEEIKAVVAEVIEKTGASSPADLGKVMGQAIGLLKKSGKTVDGKKVNALAKEMLGG